MASRDYPEEIVLKALELTAVVGQRQASRQLSIPRGSIQNWIKHPDYAEHYNELRKQNAPAWRARAAATMEELVDDYAQLEAEVLEQAATKYEKLEPRDLGNFLRSIAVAKGVTADHVGKLRGQPDMIVERRVDAAQLEAAMQKLLNTVDHDGPVEELPAGELPEVD